MSPDLIPLLNKLEPISALSPGRIKELADLCVVETVSKGLDPFRMNVVQSEQLLYLLHGELKVVFCDGKTQVLQGGSDAARHPAAADRSSIAEASAITDIQILRVDADLLDIMLTWDQLAGYEKAKPKTSQQRLDAGEWMESTGVFSAESLKNGIFRALPPANVEEMFRRMERIPVSAGQAIVRQGDEGDYYFLIESGSAEVTRTSQTGATTETVAVLNAGSAFGEEALASGNKRNASVTMTSDGMLLRLEKSDFVELLKKPLLSHVDIEKAKQLIRDGAELLDVRTAAEFRLKHVPNSINIPLPEIRGAIPQLSREKDYITYCQTGRRAAAAAFVMAQHGYRVRVLSNT